MIPCSGPSRGRSALTSLLVAAAARAVLAFAIAAPASQASGAEPFLKPDGRRTPAVHRIPLLNEDGQPIGPNGDPALPYSPRQTCGGQCHNYEAISTGWHFNAPDPSVPAGRPGQPWILTDLATGTQIPISARPWPGTWRPADLGLTPWKFTRAFGGYTNGGGYGEKFSESVADPQARWMVSGKLEIDCQSCHSGDPEQDQSLWVAHVERENFRWAATAASGLALMRGIAKTMPDTYDPLMPPSLDDPKQFPPSLAYDPWRFNAATEIFFDVPDKPPNARCYFCHTNHPVGAAAGPPWQRDEDVHLAAGMNCSDCHRHGLDHQVTRGYEGEPRPPGETEARALTCQGCHLGGDSAAAGPNTTGGRLGAPVPKHAGMPTVHFEKLTCTACHSGPWPAKRAGYVQTSQTHGLGTKGKEHRDDAPPLIQWPVFVRQADGKIGPHKIVWPAFWARVSSDTVAPLAPEAVREAAGAALSAEELKSWKPLTVEQITRGLTALAAAKRGAGEPAYISGGRMYRLDRGALRGTEHPAAQPYTWPLAHEVRPASQSLGAGGCTDCHSADAPFFFGEVVADGPADLGAPAVKGMCEFLKEDPTKWKAWAWAFAWRPTFKVIGWVACGAIAAVLLLYVFLGLAALVQWAARAARRGARSIE